MHLCLYFPGCSFLYSLLTRQDAYFDAAVLPLGFGRPPLVSLDTEHRDVQDTFIMSGAVTDTILVVLNGTQPQHILLTPTPTSHSESTGFRPTVTSTTTITPKSTTFASALTTSSAFNQSALALAYPTQVANDTAWYNAPWREQAAWSTEHRAPSSPNEPNTNYSLVLWVYCILSILVLFVLCTCGCLDSQLHVSGGH